MTACSWASGAAAGALSRRRRGIAIGRLASPIAPSTARRARDAGQRRLGRSGRPAGGSEAASAAAPRRGSRPCPPRRGGSRSPCACARGRGSGASSSRSAARRVRSRATRSWPGTGPDVGDAEVLEEPARLREVDDRVAEAARPLQEERPDARDARDVGVIARVASRASVRESLMRLRYWLTAPTVGEMLISLSLSRMIMRVLRWPMSLRASSESPLMSAASPTTTAICSRAAAQVARQGQALADGDARCRRGRRP